MQMKILIDYFFIVGPSVFGITNESKQTDTCYVVSIIKRMDD